MYALTLTAMSVIGIFIIMTMLDKVIKVRYRNQMKVFYRNLDDWAPRIAKKATGMVSRNPTEEPKRGSGTSTPPAVDTDARQRNLFDATPMV